MSIQPIPQIIDAMLHARQVDASARAASAEEVAGPPGDHGVTDEAAGDGRRPWERAAPRENPTPLDHPSPPAIDPASGGQLDVTA